MALGDIDNPDSAVLTADWNDRGANAAANPNTITTKEDIHRRHSTGAVYSYADGHVAWSKSDVNDAATRSADDNDPNTVYLATVTPGNSVATPVLSSYSGALPKTITVTCGTPGATIRYTVDGTVPTGASPNTVVSGGAIPISANPVACTLKVKAFKAGMYDSGVATGNYTGTVTGNAAPTDVVITGPTYPQPCGRHHLHRHVQRRRGAGGVQPHQVVHGAGCTAELGGDVHGLRHADELHLDL